MAEEGIQRLSPLAVQVMGDGATGRKSYIETSSLHPVFISFVGIRQWIDLVEKSDIVDMYLIGSNSKDRPWQGNLVNAEYPSHKDVNSMHTVLFVKLFDLEDILSW